MRTKLSDPRLSAPVPEDDDWGIQFDGPGEEYQSEEEHQPEEEHRTPTPNPGNMSESDEDDDDDGVLQDLFQSMGGHAHEIESEHKV